MELHLSIIGALLLPLSLLHAAFPRYFNWTQELVSLSLINRQLMIVHTFFVALMVFFMGLLCLTSAGEIVATPLGRKIALGIGLFWLIRLLFQFFVFSADLWRGKRFETAMHILFASFWTYLSAVFLSIYFTPAL